MPSRRYNYRLVKIHRSYTVDQAANLLGVHKNTVRAWVKQGLPVCDDRQPMLILGTALRSFLEAKQQRRKRRCKPNEMYCVRCRVPQQPAGKMVDFQPGEGINGRLIGLCPCCDGVMYRYSSLPKLDDIRGYLEVSIPKALAHISNSSELPVNSDFG